MNLKDKIVTTASELFSKNGFDKTTIEEIIRAADCSKGGFYHHFKSKDEILDYVIDNYLLDFKEYFSQPTIKAEDDFPSRFNQVYDFITAYKLNQLNKWDHIKNMFIFSGNDKALRSLNRKFNDVVSHIYYQLIIHGLAEKEITLDYPKETAELCTRQVLWLYDEAIKTLKHVNTLDSFYALIDYSEALISQQLGLTKGLIHYKDLSLNYQKTLVLMYSTNEKE